MPRKKTIQEQPCYKCDICKDKGYIEFEKDGYSFVEICNCQKIKQLEKEMENAGVNRDKKFETFCTDEPFQKMMVKIAEHYLDNGFEQGKWLFAGGQVGCGKTHICTAVVNELLTKGVPCKYMTWREESTKLKANINEPYFEDMIAPYKNVDVLYIDDFLKTQSGQYPTVADVNLAFLIINYRYNNSKLLTIISSELYLADIVDIDEAVGSRIVERSKGYRIEVAREKSRNYRLK